MDLNRINIYHTNDIHGRTRIFRAFEGIDRGEDSILLDSGDALQGSSTAFRFREPVLDLMNTAGYSAMAMGNRELNYIRWVLRLRAEQAKFPVLTANVSDVRGGAGGYFRPFIIKELAGVKLGIFGLTPVQYDDDSFWFRLFGLRFRNPFESAGDMVKHLRGMAHVVILLSHLGLNDDKRIAQSVQGIDMILGGHSHTPLKTPLEIKGTRIFQAGTYGEWIGRIELPVAEGAGPLLDELKYHRIHTAE